MSLDLNGYTQFKNFVDFANNEIKTLGKSGKTSIAQVSGDNRLGGHVIKANTNDTVGKLGSRTQDIKDANNLARDLFKKAVADMYGGEKNIPKIVLDEMKLNDFDKGKPLTARRILAVKTAINVDWSKKPTPSRAPKPPRSRLKWGGQRKKCPRSPVWCISSPP